MKITIQDIERAIIKEVSLDELKDNGFELGYNPEKKLIDNLEIELAIKKLPKEQAEAIKFIQQGYTYNEIEKILGINHLTIKKSIQAISAIIK